MFIGNILYVRCWNLLYTTCITQVDQLAMFHFHEGEKYFSKSLIYTLVCLCYICYEQTMWFPSSLSKLCSQTIVYGSRFRALITFRTLWSIQSAHLFTWDYRLYSSALPSDFSDAKYKRNLICSHLICAILKHFCWIRQYLQIM